ncbi:MAG: 3'(2'),5'-bisphosphate nucleotidase CysQ [Hyphomonadaceae bacterium]
MPVPPQLLDDLIPLALAAGREIMAVRAAGFDTETKLDGSPVTIADQRAEAIIEAGLQRLAPHIPMLGEEAVADGRIPDRSARYFCVDPLDGTRGFAKGGDEFTVNIALIDHGAPVLGVVYAPASGELFVGDATRALRARCDIATAEMTGALEPIQATPAKPQSGWRVLASDHSGRSTKTRDFAAKLGASITHSSSSIKFCRVAEGAADLYPRFGNVSEWDAAAGHAILNAAGGGVVRVDGSPLHYGDNADFLIRGFIAYANDDVLTAARNALGA